MKFKKITIENITAIEKAEIDFENGPLGQQPIFLIYGKTGSGKTTLLDAICLALYNNAPRLNNTPSEELYDNAINGDIKTNNPLVLVRRGANSAKVQFDFEGNDNKSYTAVWEASSVSRGTNKGKLNKSITRQLVCHPDNTVLTKVGEIDETVKSMACVGLDFDQFCRTTLLAQGEFTKFLESEESKKVAILEKLTGTKIYTEIGKKIFEITSEKKATCNDLKNKIGARTTFSDDEIKQKNEELETCQNKQKTSEKLVLEHTQKLQWLNTEQGLQSDFATSRQLLEEMDKKRNSDIQHEQRSTLADWKTTAQVRQHIDLLNKETQKSNALANEEKQLRNKYLTLSGARLGLLENIKFLKTSILEKKALLDSISDAEKRMFENSQAIIVKLGTLQQYAQEIDKSNKTTELEQKQLNELEAKLTSATEAVAAKQKTLAEKNSQLQQVRKLFDETNMPALQQKRDFLNQCRTYLQNLILAQKRVQEEQGAVQKVEGEIDRLQALVPETKKASEDAETNFAQAEKLYNQQLVAIGDHAKALRSQLHAGDKCPVCGNTIENLLSDEAINNLIKPLEDAKNEAEQLKKEKTEALKQLNNNITLNIKDLDAKKNLLDISRNQYKSQLNNIQQLYSQNQRTWNPDFETEKELLISDLATCEKQLNKAQDLLQTQNSLQNEWNDLNTQFQHSLSEKNKVETNVATCRTNIENSKKNTGEYQKKHNDLQQQLRGEICINEWDKDIQQTVDEIQRKTNEYKTLDNELKDRETNLSKFEEFEKNISANYSSVKTMFPQWPENTAPSKAEGLDGWNVLHADARALQNSKNEHNTAMAALNAQINEFYTSTPSISPERVEQLMQNNQQNIDQLATELTTFDQDHAAQKAVVETKKQEIESHLQSKPELGENDTIELLEQKTLEQKTLKDTAAETITKIKTLLEANEKTLKEVDQLNQELRAAEEEYNIWSKLNDMFGTQENPKFQRIAQSFLLEQIMASSNYYLSRFTSRYLLTAQSGTLTILVKDLYAGGQMRPATSLSGGEKFMISLSLALGLSSFNTTNNAPDTLFIDEGFATLDGNFRDTVLNTLENLNKIGNRKVGIISHVEQLRERIHTKIKVEKSGNNSSSVTIEA